MHVYAATTDVVERPFARPNEARDRSGGHEGHHERDEAEKKRSLVSVDHLVLPPCIQPSHDSILGITRPVGSPRLVVAALSQYRHTRIRHGLTGNVFREVLVLGVLRDALVRIRRHRCLSGTTGWTRGTPACDGHR